MIRETIITTNDYTILTNLLASGSGLSPRDLSGTLALERELQSAQIVAPEEVPPDVVTLNSRAELVEIGADERMEFTVVLPGEANMLENKISVMNPVGAAMLGYRAGDLFEHRNPVGRRRLKILHVHFQPEAALLKEEPVEEALR